MCVISYLKSYKMFEFNFIINIKNVSSIAFKKFNEYFIIIFILMLRLQIYDDEKR
jgi:hypothetical protein